MARPKSNTPTPGEIEILQVLWQQGVSSVREVHQLMIKSRPVAHTTVASMMQLMHDKGQLALVSQTRPFKYQAVLDNNAAKDALLNDITKRLFQGSSKDLVVHVLTSKNASKQQIAQVEKLIENVL